MKGLNRWEYVRYQPLDSMSGKGCPYICRLVPERNALVLQWFDGSGCAGHTLFFRIRGSAIWKPVRLDALGFRLKDLSENTEYELYIENDAKRKSPVRLAKTGHIPGTVVNYLHPADEQYLISGKYLGSPSLLRLPNGSLLASMDIFAAEYPQNLTILFRSDDNGRNWRHITELFPCFWGKLFLHKNKLYMLAISKEYGDLLIGASEDGGQTWTCPSVIARGSSSSRENGLHRAPCPILRSGGRIWTSVEYGSWFRNEFSDSLLSADENDDLLDPGNWIVSGFTPRNPRWTSAGLSAGGIEGNAVKAPDGSIIDFLRYAENKALLLKADPRRPERPPEFYKIVEFPMAHTKFEITRRANGVYCAVGNRYPSRNTLSMYRSEDLEHWKFVRDLLNYRDFDEGKVAFQYPSVLWERDELLVLLRTAFNGADSFHNSNCITFHRFRVERDV